MLDLAEEKAAACRIAESPLTQLSVGASETAASARAYAVACFVSCGAAAET